MTGYALLIGVLALWPLVAMAIPIRVVTPDGYLHHGVTSRLLVAAVDEWGNPIASSPLTTVRGGAIRKATENDQREGIFAYLVTPGLDAETLVVQVRFSDQSFDAELEVVQPPSSRLNLPKRIAGRAGGGQVRFEVTGDDLPPPKALQVVAGEGTVSSVEGADNALLVVVEVEDSPFPRVVPVGVRDLRRDERPTWSVISLWARPRIPLQVDPGTSATFTVGGRSYGPFVADDDGVVEAWPAAATRILSWDPERDDCA